MNKYISLLGALLLTAATVNAAQQHKFDALEYAQPSTGLQISQANLLPAQSRAERNARARVILYNEPKGDSIHYGLTAHCHTWQGFLKFNGMATNVWIDGNDIWIGNLAPFSFVGDACIHGQIDNNGTITILPQPVIKTDFNYYADVHTFSIGRLLLSEPDADNKVSVLGIDPKGFQLHLDRKTGVITSVEPEAYIALYMSQEDNATPDLTISETGTIAVDNYLYDPELYPSGELIAPPADAEPEPYSFTYINSSGNDRSDLGAVYRQGSDIWFQGIACSTLHESWVHGTINDEGVVSIPGHQYLGDEEAPEEYLYIGYGGSFVRVMLPLEYRGATQLREANALTLYYTSYDERYTLEDSQAIGIATPDISLSGYVSGLIMSPFNTIGVPQPVAPKEINLNDMTEKYRREAEERGEVYTGGPVFQVVFQWENKSIDGEYIDPSTLSYRVFLDDYLLEIQPEDYPAHDDTPGLTEPLTEIPWGLDCTGIYPYELFGLKMHIFHFYDDLFNVFGIQTINTIDGERAYSDITRVDHDGNKLEPLPADGIREVMGEQTAVRYFDVQGREVSAPQPDAFTVARITRADGSIRTVKVLVK